MKTAKFLIAAIGAIATALAGLGLTGTTQVVLTAIAAAATAIGVYLVPNAAGVKRPSTDPIRRPPL